MAIDIISKILLMSVLALASTCMALDHQPTFDLHSAIQQYMTNLKNANRLSHFKAQAMQFNRRSFDGFELEENSSFDNISHGCSVSINRLLIGLKNESEWALTGKIFGSNIRPIWLNIIEKIVKLLIALVNHQVEY